MKRSPGPRIAALAAAVITAAFASFRAEADALMDEIRRRAEAVPDAPVPCEPVGMTEEQHKLFDQYHGCYEPSRLDSRPSDRPCDDFYGFVCGPRSRAETARAAAATQKSQMAADSLALKAAAMDAIVACLASSAKTISYPRTGDSATQTISCSGIRIPAARLRQMREASLGAIAAAEAAGNTAEVQRLTTLRNEQAQWLKEQTPPIGELFQKVHVLASHGRIEGAGGAALVTRIRNKYTAMQSRFSAMKAAYIARLGDPARSPNLTSGQRNLIIRLIQDAEIAPPEAYFNNQYGRDAWGFCGSDQLNAGMDDEWSYHTHEGGTPHQHRHGMLMCPTTFMNVNDAWLDGVISHEIGHVIDPRTLAYLKNRYLTDEYLNDSTQPAGERDYYRALGTRDDASGALRTLYGDSSPDYVWGPDPTGHESGMGWRAVERTPDPSATGYPTGSYGACQETFSHCPSFEWAGPRGAASRLASNCASNYLAVNCNNLACDPCFRINANQSFETAADEMGGRILADTLQASLAARSGTLSEPLNPPDPQTVSAIRDALSVHCQAGNCAPGHCNHPPGPARILRILAPQILDSRPQLRRALGCREGVGNSAYNSVCRIGNRGGSVPTSGSECIGSTFVCPADAGLATPGSP